MQVNRKRLCLNGKSYIRCIYICYYYHDYYASVSDIVSIDALLITLLVQYRQLQEMSCRKDVGQLAISPQTTLPTVQQCVLATSAVGLFSTDRSVFLSAPSDELRQDLHA